MNTPRRNHVALNGRLSTPSTSSRAVKTEQSSNRHGASSTKTPVVIDLTGDSPPRSQKRRAPTQLTPSPYRTKKAKAKDEVDGTPKSSQEKRLRRFRPAPPQAFHEVYQRATSQRFFVLGRKRLGTPDCPEEEVEMTGSTGNIYTVHIGRSPSCTCPHFAKGNQCKHWLWVMSRVLRADFNYVYQLALLSTELQEIFAKAPPIESEEPSSKAGHDKNRKPVEGDCPICYSELEPKKEKIVWCKAACGQNIHKLCFDTWARTKRGGDVTCPLCRSVWEADPDSLQSINRRKGVTTSEGYVNVAGQLGLSGLRDTSTYYRGPGSRFGWRGYYEAFEDEDEY